MRLEKIKIELYKKNFTTRDYNTLEENEEIIAQKNSFLEISKGKEEETVVSNGVNFTIYYYEGEIIEKGYMDYSEIIKKK